MELAEYKTYKEYKAQLDAELSKTAEGFVRIGYLLKVARDTNILAESGYKTVAEFAQAEYQIDKTQVSRFIQINDRFSEGGYSDHLMPDYQGYGYAKLTLMLQLPETVTEALSPAYTKSDIQAIKEEFDEEKKVTDIERLLEIGGKTEADTASEVEKVLHCLGETEPELFVELHGWMQQAEKKVDDLKEIMAPAEEKTYSVRVPGIGRIMLMLSPSEVRLVNARTGVVQMSSWEELEASLPEMLEGTAQEAWSKLYCQPYPAKQEIAPVQPKTSKQQESKKPTRQQAEKKVTKAKPDPKPAKKAPQMLENLEKTSTEVVSGTVEGEPVNNANALPEVINSSSEPEIRANETENEPPEMPENLEKTKADTDSVEDTGKALRGYKSAITGNLSKLQALWDSDNKDKIPLMLDVTKNMLWRLERIKEMEG